MKTQPTTKKPLARTIAAIGLTAAFVFGSTTPASAWFYNTTANKGSTSVQVRNTDGRYFYIAPGNSAWNVNRAYPGSGKRITVAVLTGPMAGARWVSGCGVSIGVPGGGGLAEIRKVNC